MRISDWSSDVCSSDLDRVVERVGRGAVDLGDGIDVARHGAVPPLPLPVFPTATAARRAGSRPLLPATSGARSATGGGEESCPAAGVDPGNRELSASEVDRMIRTIKGDRKRDGAGKRVSVRVNRGGRRDTNTTKDLIRQQPNN